MSRGKGESARRAAMRELLDAVEPMIEAHQWLLRAAAEGDDVREAVREFLRWLRESSEWVTANMAQEAEPRDGHTAEEIALRFGVAAQVHELAGERTEATRLGAQADRWHGVAKRRYESERRQRQGAPHAAARRPKSRRASAPRRRGGA